MKIPHKSKEKKNRIKKNDKIKPKKEKVLMVAQEIKFARLLSGNEKKNRDKVLKTLKKWLLNCFEKKYEFKEDDFVRMWKGLFYAVWMSDKPLIQEELCESIAGVLDLFPPEHLKDALLMYKAGLRVLATEWYGVDHHRMDKFLMLVRRYLRGSLRCLRRSEWSLDSCKLYGNMISGTDGLFALKTPRYARNATSMLLHILDCYLEEIAKVSNGDIPPESLSELLRPLCAYMCGGEVTSACAGARRALTALVRQSAPGLRYQHAADAWKQMGCPTGGPEALELISDDDEDDEQNGDASDDDDDRSEKPLDPRAGRVDVELPILPVPANLLADMLREMLVKATSKAHKRVRICLQRFEQLSRDEYPLPIKVDVDEDLTPAPKQKQLAQSLQALEKQLLSTSDELALRGLSRKHRKRLLAKSRSGLSIVEDVDAVRQKTTSATNGEWQVETTEPEQKKPKQDSSHKENKKRKNNIKDTSPQKKQKIDKQNGTDFSPQKIQKVDKSNGSAKSPKLNNKKVNNIKNKNLEKQIKNKLEDHAKPSKSKENGVSKDSNNKKTGEIKTGNQENSKKEQISPVKVIDKSKKEQKTPEKVILNGTYKHVDTPRLDSKKNKHVNPKQNIKSPSVLVNKVKSFQKQSVKPDKSPNKSFDTPKKVKFVLKNNSMQAPVDYYKSIRQSPNIPYDSSKVPSKTNLKPSTPSPINPFFKKKLKLKQKF